MEINTVKMSNEELLIDFLKESVKHSESVIDFLEGILVMSDKGNYSEAAEYIKDMIRKLEFISRNGYYHEATVRDLAGKDTND